MRVKGYSGQRPGLLFLPEESPPDSYMLRVWNDVANAIQNLAWAVGKAFEVLSAGYTANLYLSQTLCALG
jgi:hypothetical protein